MKTYILWLAVSLTGNSTTVVEVSPSPVIYLNKEQCEVAALVLELETMKVQPLQIEEIKIDAYCVEANPSVTPGNAGVSPASI